MSLIILNVDEVRRTLSASGGAFVVHDKEVDIVRFAINSGFADIVIDGQVALRVMYQRPGETEVRAKTLTYYDTDGLRSYYDWHLLPSDLAEKGTLTVALCILRTDGDVEEWHTTPCQVRVLDSIHTDDSDEADETITPTVSQRVAVLESVIHGMAGGAPVVVGSVSDMTDTAQIYVLTTDGYWYYHDGSAWTAGGEYGAVATDTTLTQSGVPADAKAVGDAISISASKRDVSPVLEIVEDVRRYPKDYTNPYTNWSTSSNYYGFWFEEVKYVESVTPFFRGDTGTGIVCIYTSDEPIALNGTVRKTEEWEITIGETIELNRIITPYDLVVIHGNEDSVLRYVKNSTDVPINARIAKISANADTATVTQTLEEHRFAGVFRIKEAHAPTDHLLFKKLMVIGDSMVYGHSLRPENSWPAIVGEDLGMSVDNRGTNGAFMADYRHGGKDSSVYQKLCVNGSEFYISTEELQSCYAVVVFAGTNDCNGSVTMGETNSTNPKEFFGALNLICQELQTRSPMAKIAFITPYLRAGIEERCQNYVNAILSICSKYSIPVFDNAKNGGICWTNESIVNMLTLNDTYHLNYNGMKYVAPKYENFIKSL